MQLKVALLGLLASALPFVLGNLEGDPGHALNRPVVVPRGGSQGPQGSECPEPTTQAFFVLGCGKPIVVERADPIVSPGEPASHLHSIMGGDAFDLELDYAKTQTSTCTTCAVSKDLSNYWIPTVFFHAENGSFISVEQVGGLNVYYQERMDWTDYRACKKLQPFPKGFRMIAGDSNRRNFTESIREDRAVEFICLLTDGEIGIDPFNGFPNRPCNGGLQIRIRFPSCWDGKNVDSPDHKSHVAYPSRLDTGECPKTHPHRFVSMLYEATFSVERFNDLRKTGDQPFVLSQGDPTGYGWHADFLNGWDIDLLEKAFKDPTCSNESRGRLELCEPFIPFLQTGQQQNMCDTIPSHVKEQVDGELKALPGCNPIQAGPEPATKASC